MARSTSRTSRIWNIGDDSFDVDQGWRGKAQFILIVQGYSLDAGQGSGVGDNGFETDGAEDSDWQPVTTASIWNATVIGQPVDGDGLTAWRDNARVQYHSCVFTDAGDELVRFDNVDGDGANGYGHNGTLNWADTWTTDFDMVPPTANDCPPGTYTAQTSGKLAQIVDSVYFNIADLADAIAVGVDDPANDNVAAQNSCLAQLNRAPQVVRGGRIMEQVIFLDPRAVGDAATSMRTAPNDGFFTPVNYRGAFAPGSGSTWLCGWTASDAFGFTDSCADVGQSFCVTTTNSSGNDAVITADGSNVLADQNLTLTASGLPNGATGLFFFGPMALGGGAMLGNGALCAGGMTARMQPPAMAPMGQSVASRAFNFNAPYASNVSVMVGSTSSFQFWFRDPMGGGALSNSSDGVSVTWQ